MPKYLSGRQKRRSQDQLTEDRYLYLGLDQAEPNLSDPLVGPAVPSGSQYQLVAVPGFPGKRYWVPIGGGLIAGAISVFDEGNPVSSASSITQLNFVGAAVTANVSVQSPSGHPGIAATIIVNPVTISDDPPVGPRSGELWWESDSGDLFVYYDDGTSAQWVTTNTGGAGPAGVKGDKGQKGEKGQAGLTGGPGAKGDLGEKGEPGNVLAKGVKGDDGAQGAQGQKGDKGDVGQKGDTGSLGTKGDKGQKGEQGQKGDKGQKGLAGGGANVTISDTAPSSPSTGDLWWDSDDFDLHVYYGDTDSNQWVSITSNAALKGQKGQKGEKGEKGQKGQKGEKGELGGTGQQGPAGPQGDKGIKGDGSSVAGPPGPAGPPGSNTFTGLSDTPANYTGQADKLVSVNSTANGISFVDALSEESIQDIVGAMFSGNTETRISATYQDSDGTIDLVVDDMTSDDNTTYLLKARRQSNGGNSGDDEDPYLFLDASGGGTDDSVRLVGTGVVTVERDNDGQISINAPTIAGTKGDKGDTGTSVKGDTGAKGDTGTGVKGDKGDPGASIKGSTGSTGEKGSTGTTGEKGSTGSTGQKGATGSTGQKGATGSTGQKGATGSTGQKGQKGQKGEKGQKGQKGEKGQKGQKGQQGPAGPQGIQGNTGPTGPAGPGSDSEVGETSAAQNNTETTYNNQASYQDYVTHISTSLTPSSTSSRVMVVANFQMKQGGNQDNNRYALAKITASNGNILNTKIVGTNQNSYVNTTNNQGSTSNMFEIIAYDDSSNTSTRTYSLKVRRGHVNAQVRIRNAVIWAIEITA